MATYFNDTIGNENLTNEDVAKAVSVFGDKSTQAEAPVAKNEDARERAVAASSSAVRNQDGSTTLKNAAGGDLGTLGADGTFAANPDETTTSHLMRGADGNLRWDNGKLAGVRTQPNQDDPRIPKGGFSAQKQAEMDAASKRYAETGDLAGSMTESSKLENAAIRHNAKLQRPVDKTNVGPKVMVVGGPNYRERHADFIRKNPNAVSPQEREQFLGSTGSAFAKIAEQQRQQAANEQVVQRDALLKREAEIREKKQRDNAERTAAFGRGASLALAELKTNPVIRISKDGKHRYACSSVSPEMLAEVNAQRRGFGSTSNYGNIIAYCEIDTNGNFIGKPSVAVRSMSDGQTGKDGNYTYRKFGIDQIERGLVKAYGTLGYDKEATSSTVYDILGGFGTVGRAEAEKEKYAAEANARANQVQEETVRHNKALEQNAEDKVKSYELVRRENSLLRAISVIDKKDYKTPEDIAQRDSLQAQLNALGSTDAEANGGRSTAQQTLTTAGGATLNGASAWGDANKREGGMAGTAGTLGGKGRTGRVEVDADNGKRMKDGGLDVEIVMENDGNKHYYLKDGQNVKMNLDGRYFNDGEKAGKNPVKKTVENDDSNERKDGEKSDETKLNNKPNGASNKSNVKPSDGSIAEKQTTSQANGNPYKKKVEDNAPAKKVVDWFANKVKSGQRKNWAYEHMTSEEQNAFPGMSDSDKEALVEKVYDEYAKGKRK